MPQKGVTSNPTPLVKRRHVIGVMGSGRDPHAAMSVPLGAWLATTGCHIITGGGRGCMEMVSKSFSEVRDRRGMIIGIIPSLPVGRGDDAVNPPPGYPNPYVELVIRTHLPLSARPSSGTEATSRNHINILSSDVVIALPGSSGTWSEVQLAYRYRKPLILFLGEGGKEVEIPSDEDMGDFKIAQTLEEVKAFVTEALEKLDKAAEMRVVSPPLPMTLHNSLSESAPIIPLSTQLSNGSVGGGEK